MVCEEIAETFRLKQWQITKMSFDKVRKCSWRVSKNVIYCSGIIYALQEIFLLAGEWDPV